MTLVSIDGLDLVPFNPQLDWQNGAPEHVYGTAGIVARLWAGLKGKQDRNLLRSSYYAGKRELKEVSDIVPPSYYRLNLVLGWAARPVDMLAERVNLDGMFWAGGDLDLTPLMDDNQFETIIDQAEIATLIHGVTYFTVERGGAYSEDNRVVVQAHDALHAFGEWNDRWHRLDNLLIVDEFDVYGNPSRFRLMVDGWTLTAATDGDVWVHHWTPTGWARLLATPLVYKPRLGQQFGYSRITRTAMSLTDSAIRALIRLEGHLDIYSYPETWILGATPAVFGGTSAQALLKARMGRLKGVPDDEDAKTPRVGVEQFAASSPEPHLAALNTYAKLFAREFGLPDSSFAITDLANPTSAEAYNASQYELVAEAERTARQWTGPIRQVAQWALAVGLGRHEVGDLNTLDCDWRDPRFISQAAKADAGAKQLGAIPWLKDTEVGLQLVGLNRQQINRAMIERDQALTLQLARGMADVAPLPLSAFALPEAATA